MMTDSACLPQRDALLLGRCVYGLLVALLWPFKSPREFTPLGADHFHPPLGPFHLFESYPPPWLVTSLESAAFLLLILWSAGIGRWMSGMAVTLCLTLLSGFVYSAGKIDHDFVILLVPALLSLPGLTPRRALFFALGIYFASSGLAKAVGGWLDPTTQASLSWALSYFHVYGKTAPLLEWSLTTLPGWSWELFDQATVWFELLVPLALLPRLRPLIALAVPLFHFGTVLFFGIDFARLLLVYIPLALLCGVDPERAIASGLSARARTVLIAACAIALGASWLHLLVQGQPWSLPLPVREPGLILYPLAELALVWVLVRRRSGRAP